MDEALAVLERLRRIDVLQRERAGPHALLAELDELVVEARTLARRRGRGRARGCVTCARRRGGGANAGGNDDQVRPLNLPVGVRAILPIAATVPLFAISFGVLARASGDGHRRADRDVRDDVRGLGAVRRRLDPRRGRKRRLRRSWLRCS
jgi:hypothetical protein